MGSVANGAPELDRREGVVRNQGVKEEDEKVSLEFYEVKKEGMAVKLNYDHFSESDWDNKESISWKQPTTYDQSEMLSSFFNMENSYPWLGFSDKIEYEAYNKLEN